MKTFFQDRRNSFACALLALATLAVYWPVATFNFTNYDDPFVISANPAVAAGLTWRGIVWGLTTSYFTYWHPVTWWSHMLDVELFGMNPGMHHLMNLLLHVASTVVLFAVLQRLTGALWRSALVAALFALHPMHVESVAWLVERRDVLCGLFFLLSLWYYAGYVGEAKVASSKFRVDYAVSLMFFALALMSKPMAVTLPFVLVLLDYWPLRRFSILGFAAAGSNPADEDGRVTPCAPGLGAFADGVHGETRPTLTLRQVIWEKLPFFGLTLAACAITMIGREKGTDILTGEKFSWGLRLASVPVSYVSYLGKLIWPTDLSVLYLMPAHWEVWQVVGSLALLLAISVVVLRFARSAPYLLVGWLIYLGTLVPTIGLVQVGFHSIADRFTYLPFIGLFVALIWAVVDVSRKWPGRQAVLGALAGLVLLACAVLTWFQVQSWRDSGTLWRQCLAVNPDNAIARYNLGHFLQESGQPDEAMTQYREALRLKPNHLDANMNLGVLYVAAGQVAEATNWFARALQIKPDYDKAHLNMGLELFKLKDYRGATNHMMQVLRVNADNASAQGVCALALLELGDAPAALNHATAAARLVPNDFVVLTALGRAHGALGQSDAAVASFAEALRLNPADPEAHRYLGVEMMKRGDFAAAVARLREAVQLAPASAGARFELAVALAGTGATADAIAAYRESLKLDPDLPGALNNLAWILATHRDDKLRNGAEAVSLAGRACELTSHQQPVFIGTLAAAYAEAGQFAQAEAAAQQACAVALSTGQTNVWAVNQKLLRQYQDRKPYREAN